MLDWLTWPADQLLRIGGIVAGWFFSKDATSFTVVQMMFATLVLAAFVACSSFGKGWWNIADLFGKPADSMPACHLRWLARDPDIRATRVAAAVATTISPCHTRLSELTVIVKMNFRAIGCG